MRSSSIAALVCALIASGTALADPIELNVLETDDLRLLYLDAQAYLAPHVARSFQSAVAFQKRIFGWQPWEKTTVLLTDLSDYSNGSANASPNNFIAGFIAPSIKTLETEPGSERMFMLINHELVHVSTKDVWNRQDRRWRRFFGGKPRQVAEHPETILYNYLATPRINEPRWVQEGIASFMETWMAGGVGRAQGAYDEMVFRSMVRDGARFYSNLGLVSAGTSADFQGLTTAYLYGTRFISYLALQDSPAQVVDWFKRPEASHANYAEQFEQSFGRPLETAWAQWIAFERDFQNANLAKIRKFPVTPLRRLTPNGLGSVSRSFVDRESGTLIGGFSFPGVLAHVGAMSLKDGSVRRLADIKGPMKYRVTSSAYDPGSKTFFYTADNSDFRDLMAVNVATGETRMLLEDARIGDLAFNPADRSVWGLRHENGFVTLVRIPYPYEEFTQVHTWPYGEVAFELDISPDGKLLSSSVAEVDGGHFLRIFSTADLLAKKVAPLGQFGFGQAVPEGFVFSPDGRYLFGSSYYTGISNIFRYEIASGALEAVSNAETGLFRPMPQPDGSLLVLEHTGQGFVPAVIDPVPLKDLSAITFLGAEIAERHPVVRSWAVDAPDTVPLDAMVRFRGKYRPANEMGFESAYPVIQGYRGFGALGWHFDFADPVGLYRLGLTLSYTLDNSLPAGEKLHFDARYRTPDWHVRYWHNSADFYDLLGPTRRSRKGDALLAGYRRPLILDDPRRLEFTADAACYTGLDTLPGNQNVASGAETIRSAELGLAYSHTRRSANSVDHEAGIRWNLKAGADNSPGATFPRLQAGLDFGIPLPLAHASIWLYNAAGKLTGDRNNSLANFYFGGFQNNYLDNREVKRYRQQATFPGVEIDALGGQVYAKSLVELNLPPIRFEEVGKPGFYLGWIRPAVFASVLSTDPHDSRYRRTTTNLGGQLDLSFTLLHRLPMTLSVGYAAAFQKDRNSSGEWLLSLKILGD